MKTLKLKSALLLYWGLVLVLAAVIAVLFLVGSADAAEIRPGSLEMAHGLDFAAPDLPSSARTKQYDDKVIFRYLDDGFDTVSVVGDFNEWQPLAMEYDHKSNAWSVTVGMKPGRHSYQYLVTEGDETWEAIDPSNPHARKEAERGWVSRVTVPEGGYDTEAEAETEAEQDAVEVEEEADRTIVNFDLEFDRGIDDDEHWKTHRRRFVSRELNLKYSKLGENTSFQRVDGLSLFFTPTGISREKFGPAVKGLFSYGFRSKEWTLGGTLIQPLLENRRLMLEATGHSGTDFQDNTGIHGLENSLAGVFFREDFRDYYKREGITLSLVAYPTTTMRLEAGYETSDYSSLETEETWSFAGGDYAVNPPVDEGTLRAWFAKAMIGTRYNHILANWETGLNREGDDFDYSLLKTSYRGRLLMSGQRYLDFRVMYATGLTGELPSQRRFPVGGLGTVRGYYYQSLLQPDPDRLVPSLAKGGQRMLVGNFEYAISLDMNIITGGHDWDADWDDFEGFESWDVDSAVFFFCDTGMAWESRTADLDLEDLKTSVGVGFQIDDNGPRLDVVKTLDDGGHDTMFQLRIERMF